MAYKTSFAAPGGALQSTRAATIATIHAQLLAMGWSLADNLSMTAITLYGNLVAYTAITAGSPATITLTGHGYVLNQPVIFTSSGTTPAGLTPTQSCAQSSITNVGGNINVAIASHGFVDQQAVLYAPANGVAAVGGLAAGTIYYVVYIDTGHFNLSLTAGGAAIAWVGVGGTGTHYFGSIYFICNPLANTFQLSILSGGAAMNITTQGTGNHSFGPVEKNTGWFIALSHGLSVGNNPNYYTPGSVIGGLAINALTTGTPSYLGYYIVSATTNAFQLAIHFRGRHYRSFQPRSGSPLLFQRDIGSIALPASQRIFPPLRMPLNILS